MEKAAGLDTVLKVFGIVVETTIHNVSTGYVN